MEKYGFAVTIFGACNDDYFAFKKLLKENIWSVHAFMDLKIGHYKAMSTKNKTQL